ncbi:hypothetical protein BDF20DRAFT_836181 [Mycotypha africana]|uniref:uncharacterized protein n=1 Tax=Mycotypha africana TaxID=64632 RepID=UPI002300A136|nr:uncharacterized protein BDF20DRAFT_836181 [Mycotypha africana]KAI8977367.1 hypothetical protein BDF20DRAFT_836181 [Mycotypha africana]
MLSINVTVVSTPLEKGGCFMSIPWFAIVTAFTRAVFRMTLSAISSKISCIHHVALKPSSGRYKRVTIIFNIIKAKRHLVTNSLRLMGLLLAIALYILKNFR